MTVDGKAVTFTYDASGAPQTMTYEGATYYYITNPMGDVTGIANESGIQVVFYYYTAYGSAYVSFNVNYQTLGEALLLANPLLYRGYVYDRETGLYYLQSRYYSPKLGRFLNADALVATGQGMLGNNMFAYCLNNPLGLIDSSGAKSENNVTTPFVIVVIIDNQNSGVGGGPSGGGGGISSAALIIVLLEALINSVRYSSNTSEEVDDEAIYYGADIIGGTWHHVTEPMTFDEAAAWTIATAASEKYSHRAAWGLYTADREDAIAMTIYLGKSAAYSHHEKEKGHYAHYHVAFEQIYGAPAKNFHMWYGEKGI